MMLPPYVEILGQWTSTIVTLIGGIAGILFWNFIAHRRHERRMEDREWMKIQLLYLIYDNTRRRR